MNVRARTLCSGSGKIITATIFLLLLNKKNLASAGKTFLKNDHYIVDYALIYIYIYANGNRFRERQLYDLFLALNGVFGTMKDRVQFVV